MSEGQHIDIAADTVLVCLACGHPIYGVYATLGGSFVPPIPPKIYHLRCVPTLRYPAPKWTATERGHLMYCGRVVADMRYANARGRVQFILDALNAAEEKL